MRTVVQNWSGLGFVGRVAITVLTGVAWTVRSLQAVLFVPDYWNPVTAADFFAVYSYSAAFLLTAASLTILREVATPGPTLSWVILVVASASVVTGVANAAEDGLGISGFGLLYVLAILIAMLGMLVSAALFWASPARRLAFVPALGGLAIALMTPGGGVLALPAWVGLGSILARERGRPRTMRTEA